MRRAAKVLIAVEVFLIILPLDVEDLVGWCLYVIVGCLQAWL